MPVSLLLDLVLLPDWEGGREGEGKERGGKEKGGGEKLSPTEEIPFKAFHTFP